jgi:thiosulfate dehydrogenase [quinone] large subunit
MRTQEVSTVTPEPVHIRLESRAANVAALGARLRLAAAFASSVADRFGLWGGPGTKGVSWGDFPHFVRMLPFLPDGLAYAVAVIVTIFETTFAVTLTLGLRTRHVALGAGGLLCAFALWVGTAFGLKGTFDYSVPSAAFGSFLLAVTGGGRWSLDALTGRSRPPPRPLSTT